MTDILGPGSDAFASSTRPADLRTFAALDTWFSDCTSQTSGDGTDVSAAFLNAIVANLRGIARGNGSTASGSLVVPNDNSDGMLLAALQHLVQRGLPGRALDTGAVNALAAAFTPAPAELLDGMVFTIKAKTTNTGPATLNGLAVVTKAGAALTGGEIVAGAWQDYRYDAARNGYQVSAPAGSSAAPNPSRLWHTGTTMGGTAAAMTTVLADAVTTNTAAPIYMRVPMGTFAIGAGATLDFGAGPKTVIVNRTSAAPVGGEVKPTMDADFSWDGGSSVILTNALPPPGYPRLVQITASQNYTPSSSAVRRIAVLATAPGGPGGSVNGASQSGAGGGGGESVLAFFDVASLTLPVLCTIGAAALPSTSFSGSLSTAPSGTPTTLGAYVTANPGQSGTNGTSLGPGGLGGSGGTGGLSFPGSPGEGVTGNYYPPSSLTEFRGGTGGRSLRSGGGLGVDGDTGLGSQAKSAPIAGGNAPGPGGGGGGADASYYGPSSNVPGGQAGNGEILIVELS